MKRLVEIVKEKMTASEYGPSIESVNNPSRTKARMAFDSVRKLVDDPHQISDSLFVTLSEKRVGEQFVSSVVVLNTNDVRISEYTLYRRRPLEEVNLVQLLRQEQRQHRLELVLGIDESILVDDMVSYIRAFSNSKSADPEEYIQLYWKTKDSCTEMFESIGRSATGTLLQTPEPELLGRSI